MKKIFLLLILGIAFQVNGQDLHFTNFQMAPMHINPGLTGNYFGTVRLNGIYRGQYLTVDNNTFSTLSGSVEYNLDFGLKKNHWVAFGVNFYNDGLAVEGINETGYNISAAYHWAFDKEADNVFSFGVQKMQVNRTLGTLDLTPPSELGPNGSEFIFPGADQTTGDIENGYGSWAAGAVFSSRLNETNAFKIGLSGAHFFKPRRGLARRTGDPESIRVTSFATYYADITDRLLFKPSALIQLKNPAPEIVIQAVGSYLIDPEKNMALNFGVGTRLVDATDISFLLGMDVDTWRFALAFDYNVGVFKDATGGFGAIELGVTRIFDIHKKPKVKTVLVCPRS